eukprot:9001453-Pyramimonas_sp.AAC.1
MASMPPPPSLPLTFGVGSGSDVGVGWSGQELLSPPVSQAVSALWEDLHGLPFASDSDDDDDLSRAARSWVE